MTREQIEKLCIDAGHAINANNGRCELIEDVLCRVTTLCCDLLNQMDEEQAQSEQLHRENDPYYIKDDDIMESGEDSDYEDDDCPFCEGDGCIECDGTGLYNHPFNHPRYDE